MEKYTNFSDPVTGVNPFLRPIKRRYSLFSILVPTFWFRCIFAIPSFVQDILLSRLAASAKRPASLDLALVKGHKVFSSSYTSLYDPLVLHSLLPSPRVFVVTPEAVFSLSRYNIRTKTTAAEIEAAKMSGGVVVLLLSGTITNNELFMDVEKSAKAFGVTHFIQIDYHPATSYDINVFDNQILPIFHSLFESLVYHFLFYMNLSQHQLPAPSVYTSTVYSELAKSRNMSIGEGITMETAQKFLEMFRLDK
ncbi:hypothetical protein NEDG_01484 [Nematocida displodere]|uniref:Uncharacterized protein n=1 Tax=Nematocida displodere TaxID=1805483 RepID=A0A177EDC8_9MICR|nr:hypothetical protein NEDG_01484 [Nematocida displodere]